MPGIISIINAVAFLLSFLATLFLLTCMYLFPFYTKQTYITQVEEKRVKKKEKRSPEVFCKKGVLKSFAKFPGKHLCQSLFFNKVAGLRPGTLLKKRLWHRCFPVNFAKFLRTSFFIEHLRWLLLNKQNAESSFQT